MPHFSLPLCWMAWMQFYCPSRTYPAIPYCTIFFIFRPLSYFSGNSTLCEIYTILASLPIGAAQCSGAKKRLANVIILWGKRHFMIIIVKKPTWNCIWQLLSEKKLWKNVTYLEILSSKHSLTLRPSCSISMIHCPGLSTDYENSSIFEQLLL